MRCTMERRIIESRSTKPKSQFNSLTQCAIAARPVSMAASAGRCDAPLQLMRVQFIDMMVHCTPLTRCARECYPPRAQLRSSFVLEAHRNIRTDAFEYMQIDC